MDQRPPSARPKTSSGRPKTAQRPKTAGRNTERPPSRGGIVGNGSAIVERPLSRKGAIERPEFDSGAVVERAVSRGPNAPPPGSSLGARAVSRLGTAGGIRPGTTMRAIPPGTGQQRPVTQQGLLGARAPSRAGSSLGGRQVVDKSYYIGLLNAQFHSLDAEIESLTKELAKFEKAQSNLLVYEQRAEEQATEIKHLQGELADYNMLIDRQNTNSELKDLEFEVGEEKKRNAEISATVEELFQERREKEEIVNELEVNVEDAKRENDNLVNNMNPMVRELYESAKIEAERLSQQVDQKQKELEELYKKKEEMDIALANSPLKQQAMVLQEHITELEVKRQALLDELNAEGTPEQQRERFIEQIKKSNEEIVHMQQQIQEMSERIEQAQEELREFENDFEVLAGEKNEKYRELKLKEHQIDDFLDSFDSLQSETETKIAELSENVVKVLNLVSINIQKTDIVANVTDVDEAVLETGADVGDLQELHNRLQEELINLEENEARLKAELESMRQKQQEIEQTLHKFGDIDSVKAEILARQRNLVEKMETLEVEVPRVEAEASRLSSEITSLNTRLSDNQHYHKLKGLKQRLELVREEQKAIQEKIDARSAETDYKTLKTEALRLQKEYNAMLIAGIGGGKGG
uniref:Uncharacterized protein n=1 Tax=Acrobeloides nanus TaxID=290746 RepID=A0A914C918_9BILA